MNISVDIGDNNISVELNMHAIRISNDDALTAILKSDGDKSTNELVNHIKIEYYKLFNTDFNVSNNSMAVEIWAHVYAEKFAEAIKNISSINFVDKIADKILQHAEIIDIGEKGYDDNRFVWDSLAVFKSVIAKLLFTRQNE